MKKRSIEVTVGLFVLAGMVGLLFLALKAANLGNFTAGSTYRISARFDNIGGLKPRAPVKSAGVTVGRVASISLDRESFQGVVTLEIEQRFEFPKDTSAKILTSGLLGDQYVGLVPGGDDKDLVGGDIIRMTQSAVVLEDLIGQVIFNKAAEGGDSKGGDSKGGNAKK